MTAKATRFQNRVAFNCPGCGQLHAIIPEGEDNPEGHPQWEWNGSLESPTFSPSILAQWEQGPEKTKHRCHSFVRDGRIEFLGDCTHELAGQTADLPDWEES